jgi:type I restriction enzyme M protein
MHYTQKNRAMKRADLDDFVSCFNAAKRSERIESERFKSFGYEELTARDKASLNLIWPLGASPPKIVNRS